MPKVVDHEARRHEILDRAFRRFAADGYAAVSMRDLAVETGTSIGALYHYFPSKEALFEALVRRRASLDVEEATGGLGPDVSAPVRLAAIARFVRARADRLADTLSLVLDFKRLHRDGPFVAEVLGAYRQPLRDALGDEASSVALSLLLGALVHRGLDAEAVSLDRHLAALVAL
jgi:AcrR family transcriptional regulator